MYAAMRGGLNLQCRLELSEQHRRKTDEMDTSARTRVSDASLIHCGSFALWWIVAKNKNS